MTALPTAPHLPAVSLALTWLLLGASCSESPPEGFTLSGTVEGAGGMQVFLDHAQGPNGSVEPLDKVSAAADGSFAIALDEVPPSGVYRLRIGAARAPIVLDGTEGDLTVTSSLDRIKRADYDVTGSPAAASLQGLLEGMAARTLTNDDVVAFVDTTSSPYAAAHAAELTLGQNGQYLGAHERAVARLHEAGEDGKYAGAYAAYVNQVKAAYARAQAQERIRVGEEAPDIELTDPDGELHRLSDLKGKVVLLDFWAAWCGPCRRENPNVVRVYDEYHDDGFEVFSVSLDGLDSRSKARLGTQEQIAKAMEQQHERWTTAIAQDGLKWPDHVSDLQKWESYPVQVYGVTSIPATFIIDRDGKIAAVNARGGRLEEEVKRLL